MRGKLVDKLCKDYTPFEKKVFRVVCQIPFGQTRSYKWVADKIGRPEASRAVGRALNKNPFPLTIPCHRVVRSKGDVGGYRWGKEVKKRLLEMEATGNVCAGKRTLQSKVQR
jgi:methylated-DNA-[protein]-cysteine S-methyltransferase